MDTRKNFAQRLNELEGGSGCVIFGSAEEAFDALFAPLCRDGGFVVASRNVSPRTLELLRSSLENHGAKIKLIDSDHPCQAEQAACSGEALAIFTETCTPGANIAPLDSLANIAKRNEIPLIIDNTLITPALCRPAEHGASAIFYADLKNLTGRDDVTGAAIVDGGNFDWGAKTDVFAQPSGNGGPELDGALLDDLRERMTTLSEETLKMARLLEARADVASVLYPGLESHHQRDMAKVYLKDGCGGKLAFTTAKEDADAADIIKECQAKL